MGGLRRPAAFLELGQRYEITGIVHLAAAGSEVIDAVRCVDAYTQGLLNACRTAHGRDTCLDIARIREDAGYEPTYGIEHGMADYVAWLGAGHER